MDNTATRGEPAQEEVRKASMRLPENQREALALRELDQLSYDEIATIMDNNRGTVAQLISRARINLRDELGGTVLASVAPTAECERALSLIAMREDGELDATSADAAWLDTHLADCDRCRLAVEAMRDAGASYRAWAATRTRRESPPGTPSAALAAPGRGKSRRRAMVLAGGAAMLLSLAGLAVALTRDDTPTTPASPAAGAASGQSTGTRKPGAKPAKARKGKEGAGRSAKEQTASTPAPTPVQVPTEVQTPSGGGAPSQPSSPSGSSESGKTAVQPTQQKSVPQSSSKPAPAPQPATTPAPTSEEPSATEPPKGPPKKQEPGGKKK
jgi:predicted DNA-binding protein (UPF0251 family)